jgi:hypothetical protein
MKTRVALVVLLAVILLPPGCRKAASPPHVPPPGSGPGAVIAPPPGAGAEAQPATITVHATRTGAKYHRAGCRYLAKSQIPMPLDQAKQRYGPCKICNPPQ